MLEILTKGRSQSFYKPTDVHSVANSEGEIVSSISLWDIVNQFIKHDFPAVLTFIVGRKKIT